jgi:TRAP-type C4-dicarboxylate transport system permease small subunit
LLLGLVMALMAWRASLGGLNAWRTQSGSMMLGFPEWIVYACIVPAFMLTALIALMQSLRGFDHAQPA